MLRALWRDLADDVKARCATGRLEVDGLRTRVIEAAVVGCAQPRLVPARVRIQARRLTDERERFVDRNRVAHGDELLVNGALAKTAAIAAAARHVLTANATFEQLRPHGNVGCHLGLAGVLARVGQRRRDALARHDRGLQLGHLGVLLRTLVAHVKHGRLEVQDLDVIGRRLKVLNILTLVEQSLVRGGDHRNP